MNRPTSQIWVDRTEQSSNRKSSRLADIQRYLSSPSTAVEDKLEYGDVWWNGVVGGMPVSVGVEIKSVSDLVQCIRTGRFAAHQLPGLHETYDHTWLLIEGEWRPNPKTGILEVRAPYKVGRGKSSWGWKTFQWSARQQAVMWADVVKWLATMEVVGGVRVEKVGSREETARWVVSMWSWYQKDVHDSLRVLKQVNHPKFYRLGTVGKMAAQLESVGYEKAVQADQLFESPRAMVEAGAEEWRRIKGVGKKGGEAIVAELNRKRNRPRKGKR